jgi:hypothetical protein
VPAARIDETGLDVRGAQVRQVPADHAVGVRGCGRWVQRPHPVFRPPERVAERLPTSGCPAYSTSFSRSPLIALPQMS